MIPLPAGKRWYLPVRSASPRRWSIRIHVLAAAAALALGWAWSGLVRADIDDSAYDTASQRISAAKRRDMEADFARERQREADRERLEREAEARAEAGRQAALAARPYPVRLLEKRCTACHAAEHYMGQSHTLPGWWFVVLRMKVWNAAELDGAEMSVLATHLTQIRPAAGTDAALEYAAIPLLLTLLFAAGWGWRRVHRQRQGDTQ